MMFFILFIPVLTMMSALMMYQFTGRRQIMKFDLVQFFYAFLVSPVMFVWLKSFLFFLLRSDLNLKLSVTSLFVLDTVFTLIFLYIFAFVVIHTLTKTFDIHRDRDPFYDIFEHTEFLHMEASHFAIYFGVMCILSFVSFINVLFPANIVISQGTFYAMLLFGLVIGFGGVISIWLYESDNEWFHKFMKLAFAGFFVAHAVLYFLLDPAFSGYYLGYWFVFAVFFISTFLSLFAEKREEERRFKIFNFTLNWKKPSTHLSVWTKSLYRKVKES